MRFRRLGVVGVVALSLLVAAAARGASDTSSQSEPIVLGAAVNLSGFEQPYDGTALRGAMFAIQDINARGGVNGRKLTLVTADGKSDAATGGTAATTVMDKGAEVVLAPCNITSAAAPTANKAGLLAMSLCSGAPEFGPAGIGPLSFSAGTAANLEGAVAAEYAYKKKGWRSVYFLELSSFSYTKDVTKYFQQRWIQMAGKKSVKGYDTFQIQDTSLAAQISRLAKVADQVDFVQTCDAPPSIVVMLRGMRSAGINLPVISCVAADGDYWLKGVRNLNGFYNTAYGSVYGDDSNKAVRGLIARYTRKYKSKPPNSYIVQGYASVQLVARAIRAAGGSTDGADLQKALEKFKNVPTIGGPMTYTSKIHIRHTPADMAIMQVKNGKPRFLTRFTPTGVPPIKF